MKEIADVLVEHMKHKGLRYDLYRPSVKIPGMRGYVLPLEAERCLLTCRVIICEGTRYVRVETCIGVRVQEHQCAAVGEFLTRANCEMKLGYFQLDMCSGEVAYVVAATFEESEVSEMMLHRLISNAVGTYDEVFPGLVKVIFCETEPREAIEEIKRRWHAPRQRDIDLALERLFNNSGP